MVLLLPITGWLFIIGLELFVLVLFGLHVEERGIHI